MHRKIRARQYWPSWGRNAFVAPILFACATILGVGHFVNAAAPTIEHVTATQIVAVFTRGCALAVSGFFFSAGRHGVEQDSKWPPLREPAPNSRSAARSWRFDPAAEQPHPF